MAEFKFDAATFEMVQGLVFPLVKGMFGIDVEGWVGEKSELFTIIGEGFGDLQALFLAAGAALEDGKLTAEEIETIITDAKTVTEAVDRIVAFFETDDEPVQPGA